MHVPLHNSLYCISIVLDQQQNTKKSMLIDYVHIMKTEMPVCLPSRIYMYKTMTLFHQTYGFNFQAHHHNHYMEQMK